MSKYHNFISAEQALRQLEMSSNHYTIDGTTISLGAGGEEARISTRDAAAIDYLCRECGYSTVI